MDSTALARAAARYAVAYGFLTVAPVAAIAFLRPGVGLVLLGVLGGVALLVGGAILSGDDPRAQTHAAGSHSGFTRVSVTPMGSSPEGRLRGLLWAGGVVGWALVAGVAVLRAAP